METIFEIILFMIFQVPGAFIRWLLGGCKKPFKEVLKNGDGYIDGSIGLVIVVLIILLVTKLID